MKSFVVGLIMVHANPDEIIKDNGGGQITKNERTTETRCPTAAGNWKSHNYCHGYEKAQTLKECSDECKKEIFDGDRPSVDLENGQRGCTHFAFDHNKKTCTICRPTKPSEMQPEDGELAGITKGKCFAMESVTTVDKKYILMEGKTTQNVLAVDCRKTCQNDLACRYWSWSLEGEMGVCTTSAKKGRQERDEGSASGSCEDRRDSMSCPLINARVAVPSRAVDCPDDVEDKNCVVVVVDCRYPKFVKNHGFTNFKLWHKDGNFETRQKERGMHYYLSNGELIAPSEFGHVASDLTCGMATPACYPERTKKPLPCTFPYKFDERVNEVDVQFAHKDFYHTEPVMAQCVASGEEVQMTCRSGIMKFKKTHSCSDTKHDCSLENMKGLDGYEAGEHLEMDTDGKEKRTEFRCTHANKIGTLQCGSKGWELDFDRERRCPAKSEKVCKDWNNDWKDAFGRTCSDYVENGYCRHGKMLDFFGIDQGARSACSCCGAKQCGDVDFAVFDAYTPLEKPLLKWSSNGHMIQKFACSYKLSEIGYLQCLEDGWNLVNQLDKRCTNDEDTKDQCGEIDFGNLKEYKPLQEPIFRRGEHKNTYVTYQRLACSYDNAATGWVRCDPEGWVPADKSCPEEKFSSCDTEDLGIFVGYNPSARADMKIRLRDDSEETFETYEFDCKYRVAQTGRLECTSHGWQEQTKSSRRCPACDQTNPGKDYVPNSTIQWLKGAANEVGFRPFIARFTCTHEKTKMVKLKCDRSGKWKQYKGKCPPV